MADGRETPLNLASGFPMPEAAPYAALFRLGAAGLPMFPVAEGAIPGGPPRLRAPRPDLPRALDLVLRLVFAGDDRPASRAELSGFMGHFRIGPSMPADLAGPRAAFLSTEARAAIPYPEMLKLPLEVASAADLSDEHTLWIGTPAPQQALHPARIHVPGGAVVLRADRLRAPPAPGLVGELGVDAMLDTFQVRLPYVLKDGRRLVESGYCATDLGLGELGAAGAILAFVRECGWPRELRTETPAHAARRAWFWRAIRACAMSFATVEAVWHADGPVLQAILWELLTRSADSE